MLQLRNRRPPGTLLAQCARTTEAAPARMPVAPRRRPGRRAAFAQGFTAAPVRGRRGDRAAAGCVLGAQDRGPDGRPASGSRHRVDAVTRGVKTEGSGDQCPVPNSLRRLGIHGQKETEGRLCNAGDRNSLEKAVPRAAWSGLRSGETLRAVQESRRGRTGSGAFAHRAPAAQQVSPARTRGRAQKIRAKGAGGCGRRTTVTAVTSKEGSENAPNAEL